MRHIVLASLFISAVALAQAPPTPEVDGTSLATIRFRTGSSRLTDAERDQLQTVARWHAKHPDAILILEGHAAQEGSRTSNLRVSQRRTEAVRDVLVAQGANRERIVLAAYGDAAGSRARGRVVIHGNTQLVELAREQNEVETGEDARARAARGADAEQQRRSPAPVRGRELDGDEMTAPPPRAGNTTIVIVPPPATSPSTPGD